MRGRLWLWLLNLLVGAGLKLSRPINPAIKVIDKELDQFDWHNPADKRAFRSGILSSVLMAKGRGMGLWHFIRICGLIWTNQDEEMTLRTRFTP